MRLVVARRHGHRGEGLGNEILPWAKGWIASQVLNAHLVGPSWGINKRRYYRNFRTSRFDVLLEELLLRLPHHAFTEQEYRATGEVDFGDAIVRWATDRGLDESASFIVSVAGMWGGYPSIRNARAFLLSKLLNSKDALRNAFEVTSKLDRNKLFVAVHMRSPQGGHIHLPSGETARGKFNILIPGDWYLWVCEALRKQFGDRIEFCFFTDRGGPDFDEAVRRFNPSQPVQRGLTECSDLWLMTDADLRICSISSYSLTACFLSGGPYLWYEPQLTLSQDVYSLWGNTESQKADGSLSLRSAAFVSSLRNGDLQAGSQTVTFPGAAMNIGDPLPASLIALLDQKLSYRDSRTNLIEYGGIPGRRQTNSAQDCPS